MVAKLYDAALFDLFGTLVTERGEAVRGARDVLSGLTGARWAIVTSCSRRFADALLDRAGLPRPKVMVTAQDVQESKPAPDGYLRAASELEVQPSHCLVFEDSAAGILAARAAGMSVINVCETALDGLALEIVPNGRLRLRT